MNSVGVPKDNEDHGILNVFSPQDEFEPNMTRATMHVIETYSI